MSISTHWLGRSFVLGFLAAVSVTADTYTWTGAVSSEWNNSANWTPSTGVPGEADTAVINSGTPTVSTDTSVARLELTGGSLGGPGTLTVTNALVWGGESSMQGGGTTVIAPGAVATLSGNADRNLRSRLWINQGTLAHPGPCRLVFWDGSRLENAGLADLQGDVVWVDGGGSALSTLVNAGTVRKSAGSATATLQSPRPWNTGTVEVWSGTLDLPNGVVGGGNLHAADTTQILYRGLIELTNVVLSGLGLQRVAAGAVFEGTVSAQNLEWAAGTIQGTHTLSGTVAWTGGELAGVGTTTLAPQATLRLLGDGDHSLRSRTVLIQGTLEHVGNGRVVFWDQVHFEIAASGLVDLQSDATWVDGGGSGPSTLINTGTLRKQGGTGTSYLQNLNFDNRGTLGAWQGTLEFNRAPALGVGTRFEHGLAGPTHPEGYGRITCSQPLALTGQLIAVFRNGFIPGAGQRYDVLNAPIQGVFEGFAAPPISPTVFINPEYRADGVSLVTTDPTPIIQGLTRLDSEGRFHLSIRGIANLSYVVLASTDFEEWTPLATNAVPASTLWEFIDVDSATMPWRFYRVFYQP